MKAKNFSELRARMSNDALVRSKARADVLLAEVLLNNNFLKLETKAF